MLAIAHKKFQLHSPCLLVLKGIIGYLDYSFEIMILKSFETNQMNGTSMNFILLNQAHAWFLIIDSVREFLYVYVCVSAPEAINN